MSLAERIDALLPQTQCRRCGYPACRPYAEVLAAGREELNRCPPGGSPTIEALARLLGRPPLPVAPECGAGSPPAVAVIEEAWCIGCTLCIQACPVDAIVGAAKLMHTVIAGECTGCELCLDPCPVDCIRMVSAPARGLPALGHFREADRARARYRRRQERLARAPDRKPRPGAAPAARDHRRQTVAAALARARARRRTAASGSSGRAG